MKLNRSLIKEQAKQLISGKVFKLFIIIIVVALLSGGLYSGASSSAKEINDNKADSVFSEDNYGYGYSNDADDLEDYFNQFGSGSSSNSDNPIDSFGNSSQNNYAQENASSALASSSQTVKVLQGLASIFFIIAIVLCALEVTLCGYMVIFIRTRRDIPLGADMRAIFANTFDKTYGKKLGLVILRELFTGLLTCLLIVPGVIYYYSTYFSYEIMADHPNLSPTRAGELSRKMIRGHRGELFALDLSFIGWFILTCITCGIASIYTAPYYMTTRALYYQNFVNRGIAEGTVVEEDFVSDYDKAYNYANAQYNNESQNQYTPQYQAPQYSGNGTQYQAPPQTHEQYADSTYYQPQQPVESEPVAQTPVNEEPIQAETVVQEEPIQQNTDETTE